MLRSLSEYVIGGLITNISFLKLIINHKLFRAGKFDINLLNDEFMSKLAELEDNQLKGESEKAAAVLVTLIKFNSSSNNHHTNNIENSNQWQEQMYE